MNCKDCMTLLPDLILDPENASSAALTHIESCAECRVEYTDLRKTFAMLDAYTAPEPTAWFDQRLAVRLREEQAKAPAGLFERLRTRLLLNTGAHFRPAMTAALAAILAIGGSSGAVLYQHEAQMKAQHAASATVEDLQILDRNEQAIQQLDQLIDDEGSDSGNASAAPVAPVS
jgi:hypothetical protein